MDRHRSWLLRSVGYFSRGEHDVESVVQDVWLDVMRGAASYRGNGSVRS
ncbi:sigma factor [Actinomycetospora atypica]|uniref:Sigma factor n=1 Tax=Actinomycetospora atypica TaxID=1290095 RepID=A0ABV9YSS6_9PSEU